jgi:tetratricopeptide (TPR) repeat protein
MLYRLLLILSLALAGTLGVHAQDDADAITPANAHLVAVVERIAQPAIQAIDFSPDGTTLAVGLFSGEVVFYDTATWEPISTVIATERAVFDVAYAPDGAWLAVVADPATRLYDITSGEFVAEVPNLYRYATWNPASDQLALTRQSTTGQIAVFDLVTEPVALDFAFGIQADYGYTMPVYNPAGDFLAVGTRDPESQAEVQLYDTAEGRLQYVLNAGQMGISDLFYSGDRLYAQPDSGALTAWAGTPPGTVGLAEQRDDEAFWRHYAPLPDALIATDRTGNLGLFDRTRSILTRWQINGIESEGLTDIAAAPDGGQVVLSHADTGLFILAVDPRPVTTLLAEANSTFNIATRRARLDAALIEAEANEPDRLAEIYTARGTFFLQQETLNIALADFTRAIERDESFAPAYLGRAAAYFSNDNYRNALADYVTVAETLGADLLGPVAAYQASRSAYAEDDDQRTIDFAEIAIAQDYELLDRAYELRALGHLGLGNPEQAIADLTLAIEANPDNANLYRNRAFVYASRFDDRETALVDYMTAAEINPTARNLNDVAWTLYRLGRYSEGLPYVERALEQEPDYGSALDTRGWLYLNLGNLDAAREDFIAAINQQTDYAYYGLAELFTAQGRYEEAYSELQTYFRRTDDDDEDPDAYALRDRLEDELNDD